MNSCSTVIATIATAAVFMFGACGHWGEFAPEMKRSRAELDAGARSGRQEFKSAKKSSRLESVRARGRLNCMSHVSFPGFGYQDSAGTYRGFDIDLCRAVAAAVFGDPNAVEVQPRTFVQRAEAMQSGKGDTDMLSMTTTWTPGRDARWGNFTVIMFYNGQGFMVRADSGYDSVLDMDGAIVCVTSSTTTELNLEEYFRENELGLETVVHEDRLAVYQAYEQGLCDAVTDDVSALEAVKHGFASPDEHKLLPETISKEPLSPLVPHGDEQWFDLVKTVMYVLINAEELGVTQANVESMRTEGNTAARRLVGAEGEYGQADLGLKPDFAVDVIQSVGNYGEIYDRYMGPNGESFTMPRGANKLWSEGGLIYAPPLR